MRSRHSNLYPTPPPPPAPHISSECTCKATTSEARADSGRGLSASWSADASAGAAAGEAWREDGNRCGVGPATRRRGEAGQSGDACDTLVVCYTRPRRTCLRKYARRALGGVGCVGAGGKLCLALLLLIAALPSPVQRVLDLSGKGGLERAWEYAGRLGKGWGGVGSGRGRWGR